MRAGSAGERESQADSRTRTRGNPGGRSIPRVAARGSYGNEVDFITWGLHSNVRCRRGMGDGAWKEKKDKKRSVSSRCSHSACS